VGGAPVAVALVLAPAAACAAAAAVIAVVRMLFSTMRQVTPERRAVRSAAERVLARLLLAAALWLVGGGIWLAGVALANATAGSAAGGAAPVGAAGALALLTTLFTRVLRVMSLLPKGSTDGSRARRLVPLAPQTLAYVIIGGIAVLAASALVAAHRGPPLAVAGLALPLPCAVYTAAVLVVLVTLRWFDPNTVGLHAFYRARLARAYLGASNEAAARHAGDPAGGGQSEEQDGDDFAITRLAGQRPVHLVCCAANDIAPRDPVANLRRGARSAVLSAFGFGVGDAATAWDDAGTAGRGIEPVPPETLGAAMTASAAAFNSQMGIKSVQLGPAVTFLLTALNLRLGRWLPHPDERLRSRPARLFPGIGFFRELFGRTCAEAPTVHLSDGGHFENLAVYELVRRQCRYILVSDCGADPQVAFDDFGTLVRRVRQDFGVEIDIDLAPLHPGPDGHAVQHMVAGDVHYPTGDVGVLLYVKPTLAGSEPPDVTQYRTRNPAFPHESTGDQFYDEAQWESYRRLGLHTARVAFADVVRRLGADADPTRGPSHEAAARVFASARQQWLPVPPGFAERAPALAERCARLDAALHAQAPQAPPVPVGQDGRAAAAPLVRGVYWELAQLADTPDAPLADLERALPLVREALLQMEETYNVEPLARSRHPVYLGTLNYFARWADLPAMRFWWPMLRALHAPGFVTYAEQQFGLSGAGGVRAPRYRLAERQFGAGGRSHVERAWLDSGHPEPGPTDTCLQLTSALAWGGGAVEVPLAMLVVRPHLVHTAPADERRLALFDADWLFVPPGLWGAGVGSALLRMCAGPGDDALAWAAGLLVRVPQGPRSGLAAWREHAAVAQLYRAQGFADVHPGRGPSDVFALDTDAAARVLDAPDPFANAAAAWRWMYRPIHGARRPAGAAGGPGGLGAPVPAPAR
jgi:GNAT superfamily N-acetyltransferase